MRITVAQRAQHIALKRLSTLRAFDHHKQGATAVAAARAVGCPGPTLWRWGKAYALNGLAGLVPRFANGGRRSAVAGIVLTEEQICEFERLHFEGGGFHGAWRAFLNSPKCPPAMARSGLKTLPECVARQVKTWRLHARCSVSADGRRLFVRVNRGGAPK